MGRVLLVDDEPEVRRAFGRLLVREGHAVTEAESGEDAQSELVASRFDVIVTDVNLPGVSGIEFLRTVRGHDLDVPVIVITGAPGLGSATQAVEFGAFRYLTKPIEIDALVDAVARAEKMHALARIKREALSIFGDHGHLLGDRASLEARFGQALSSLWIACQPIVECPGRLFGYEALLRTDEPTLVRPGDFLEAGERLGRLNEVGRAVRDRVAEMIPSLPPDARMFVNLHAADLHDDHLYAPTAALSAHSKRVVLEITERASLDGVRDVQLRVKQLRDLGFQIAVDDLGAGYAGLTALAQIEPEVVKLDTSIVRDVDRSGTKRRVIGSVNALCREMGIRSVCEGVETLSERNVLVDSGGDLLQGYLFGRPGPGLPEVQWPE
jgi:EAL domain-containing protein (putative c-di-GMP-specific phosphodiesterase class I)